MDVLLFGLLVPGLLFIITTTLILLHNRIHFLGLGDTVLEENCQPDWLESDSPPLVSILIPARNEEQNLPRLLKTLQEQDWPRLEIHILDDHSEDNTLKIAEEFQKNVNTVYGKHEPSSYNQDSQSMQVIVHKGQKRPDGWLGKNWACHQLSRHANGDLFIFLDADTWLASNTISRIVSAVDLFKLDFATVWPHQIMESIAEKAVISTVYSTIANYLPTLYSYRAPAWIPSARLRQKVKPMFANACGQCMVFTRQTYLDSGGHELVRDQVVEDVIMAKMVVRSGKTMRMFHGTDHLWCRMYRTPSDLFNGFRKNFFAGFGYRYLPFLMAWLLHFVVFVVPVIVLGTALICISCLPDTPVLIGGYTTLLGITVLQRLYISMFLNWPVSTALLYLPGILWFHMLATVVLRDRLSKTKPTWKGRPV